MRTVQVRTQNPYDVLIGHGLLGAVGRELLARHERCRVLMVTDAPVWSLYGETVYDALEAEGFRVSACAFPEGAQVKTLSGWQEIIASCAQGEMARGDVIVALGGGRICDVAGFAAATYLHGIEWVQVPTTLRAAVDATVGGRTSLSLPGVGHGRVGACWHPMLSLCDCQTYLTQDPGTFEDGVAECLKFGMLCDRTLFEEVAQGALDGDCADAVARSVAIKADLYAKGQMDENSHHLLRFGSTFAYAVKALSGHAISHGRALAIGMAGAARLAEALDMCVMGCAGVVMAMLDRLGLPSEAGFNPYALSRAAIANPERVGNDVALVLPESIGRCIVYKAPARELPRLFRLAMGDRT